MDDNDPTSIAQGFARRDAECAGFPVDQARRAICLTASQGTYDEMAIRKAVSFELAEMIVDARRAFEQVAGKAEQEKQNG